MNLRLFLVLEWIKNYVNSLNYVTTYYGSSMGIRKERAIVNCFKKILVELIFFVVLTIFIGRSE